MRIFHEIVYSTIEARCRPNVDNCGRAEEEERACMRRNLLRVRDRRTVEDIATPGRAVRVLALRRLSTHAAAPRRLAGRLEAFLTFLLVWQWAATCGPAPAAVRATLKAILTSSERAQTEKRALQRECDVPNVFSVSLHHERQTTPARLTSCERVDETLYLRAPAATVSPCPGESGRTSPFLSQFCFPKHAGIQALCYVVPSTAKQSLSSS